MHKSFNGTSLAAQAATFTSLGKNIHKNFKIKKRSNMKQQTMHSGGQQKNSVLYYSSEETTVFISAEEGCPKNKT